MTKWRRWLDRIENDQLQDLLINRHIFHQFRDCITPHLKSNRGSNLSSWMAQNYVASATTAIRRVVEPVNARWKSISLVILLTELAANESLLTRDRFRKMHKNSVTKRFADRDFARIAGSKTATHVSKSKINRDICALMAVAKKIKKLVDKVIAHTEEDRRKIPCLYYGQIDKAVDIINEIFQRYSLLLKGSFPSHTAILNDFDVAEDLKQIWP